MVADSSLKPTRCFRSAFLRRQWGEGRDSPSGRHQARCFGKGLRAHGCGLQRGASRDGLAAVPPTNTARTVAIVNRHVEEDALR